MSGAEKRVTDLESDLVGITAERDEARAALQGRTTQIGALKEQLSARAAEIATLTQRVQQKEAQIAQAAAAQQRATQELGAVRGQVASVTAHRDAAAAQVKALQAQKTALQQKVADLRMRLPPEEGGEATLKDAQKQAAQLNAEYLTLHDQLTKRADPAVQSQLQQKWHSLGAAQFLVARLIGAHGTYTVRPGDSLSTIAAMSYGDGARWQDILKANAYLLEKPDHIVPGMILVIP